MKKIILTVFLGIAFSTLVFAQDVRYENYLKRNHLSVLSTDITGLDSINLLNSCEIKFSSNDSLMFVDLITKDTVVPVLNVELYYGSRGLGWLQADFDNCFFWGWRLSNNTYGRIFYKTYPYFRIKGDFIYIDANIKQSVLVLTDPNCEEDCFKTIFVFNAKTGKFTTYLLKKELPTTWIDWDIKFVNIAGNTITLKDVVNNEVYKGIKVKNKSDPNSVQP